MINLASHQFTDLTEPGVTGGLHRILIRRWPTTRITTEGSKSPASFERRIVVRKLPNVGTRPLNGKKMLDSQLGSRGVHVFEVLCFMARVKEGRLG